MKTIIPSSANPKPRPANNMKFVNSRAGGPAEHKLTNKMSGKHQNPEYFKRQTDRKNSDNDFQSKQFSKGAMY